jgi:hypothetical protein
LSCSWTTACHPSSDASSASIWSTEEGLEEEVEGEKDAMVINYFVGKSATNGKVHGKVRNLWKSEKNERRSIFRDPKQRACPSA